MEEVLFVFIPFSGISEIKGWWEQSIRNRFLFGLGAAKEPIRITYNRYDWELNGW